MGQKINLIGNCLGYIRGWDFNWYVDKNYVDNVIEDERICKYLDVCVLKGGIVCVIIECIFKCIIIIIYILCFGIIIGKGGVEVDCICEEFKKFIGKDVQINIIEICKFEFDVNIVVEFIIKQLEVCINYCCVIKMVIQFIMCVNVEGIKVCIFGCLNGFDMSCIEEYKEGCMLLYIFCVDIDYVIKEVLMVYGIIGVKVWICKGEVFGKCDLNLNVGLVSKDNCGGNCGGGCGCGGNCGGGCGCGGNCGGCGGDCC